MKRIVHKHALQILFLFAAAGNTCVAQGPHNRPQDDVWLTEPQVRPFSRVYSFLDANLQDMANIQAASTTIDPNSTNAYSIDAFQQSLQGSVQFNKLNGIVDAAQTQFLASSAAAQNQLLSAQNSLVVSVQAALQAYNTAQSAVPANQTDIANALSNYSTLLTQLASLNKLVTLSTPANLASTSPVALSQPSAGNLAASTGLTLPASNTPNFPSSKKLDNIQQFYWDRLTRLVNTLALPQKYEDASLYFVSFSPSVVRTYKRAAMLETRYELACQGNGDTNAAPVILDLYPRDAAVNIASENWRDRNFGFSAILSFFSIGAAAGYNQEHLKASQAMAQSSYISGYGIGSSTFGWLFGKMLGEDSITVGVKPTEALIAVPPGCTTGWTVTPREVQWIGNHQNALSHAAVAPTLAYNTPILTHDVDPSDPPLPPLDLTHKLHHELRSLEFDTVQYDPTSSTTALVTLTIQTRHPFDPQMTVTVDGYLVKRARDFFGRATSGTGTSGLLESTALVANTWIPISQDRLLLLLDGSNFTTHFPRIALVNPRITYDLQSETSDAKIMVDSNTLARADATDVPYAHLPPLAFVKGTSKNLLVTRWKADSNDATLILSSPDDLPPVQQASAAATANQPTLQVVTQNQGEFWSAQSSVTAILPEKSPPAEYQLLCIPHHMRLLCTFPKSRKGKTYYGPEEDYLIKVADAGHAVGPILGSVQLPTEREAPIQPLVWKVTQPIFNPKYDSWKFTVELVNVSNGDPITLSNSTGATILNSIAHCEQDTTQPCSAQLTVAASQFGDVEDAMQLTDVNKNNGKKATIANLHAAMSPLIGVIDLTNKKFYGKNLAFNRMQIDNQAAIPLSCLPDRTECEIPAIPASETGFLYFLAGAMQVPWYQASATGLTALKQDALLPPPPPKQAVAPPTPGSPTTTTTPTNPTVTVTTSVYALQ